MEFANVKVSIEAIKYDLPHERNTEEPSWHLVFNIESTEMFCAFDVQEPYLESIEKWRTLAQGHGWVDLGHGSISVEGEYYKFNSQEGLNVLLCLRVPKKAVCDRLGAALDDAVAKGLWFTKD